MVVIGELLVVIGEGGELLVVIDKLTDPFKAKQQIISLFAMLHC